MQKVRVILQKKPLFFLIGSILYIVILAFIKWNIHLTVSTGLFVVGGVIGMYFLEAAESFFHLEPSPFRSVVFVGLFALVSFFVITSSGSMLAIGLVLSIYLTLVFWQLGEWMTIKNLNRWCTMLADPIQPRTQFWLMLLSSVFFLAETYIFLRGAV